MRRGVDAPALPPVARRRHDDRRGRSGGIVPSRCTDLVLSVAGTASRPRDERLDDADALQTPQELATQASGWTVSTMALWS